MTTRDVGGEGFKWFIGFVEDITDKDQLGMVKVRVPNLHGQLTTEDLPYATVMTPAQSASHLEEGLSPNGLVKGSMVFGFFMDGNETNIPVIVGTIPKINNNDVSKHDVSKLARGTNSIRKQQVGPEPGPAYAAKYPFNKTFTTKSGHAIEIDDTPGQERIHVFHKSGTYTEIDKTGRKVDKVADSSYEIIVKDQTVYVGGNVKVIVKGNVDIKVDGTYTVTSSGNMKFKAPRVDIN